MEQELIDPSANDPASKAFDRLRREVTTMRLAVEHLADAPGKIEIPDYSATLEKLAKATQANAAHIESMSEKPGLQMTPGSLSDAIIEAGSASRAADHAALVNATTAFQNAHQTLTKSLVSARAANEQDKRLKKVSINCLIAGMIIWAIVPGPIIRALPASWHLPERLAARAVGMDPREAGQKLMEFSDPNRWNQILIADRILRANGSVISVCLNTAARNRKNVRCIILISPQSEARKSNAERLGRKK